MSKKKNKFGEYVSDTDSEIVEEQVLVNNISSMENILDNGQSVKETIEEQKLVPKTIKIDPMELKFTPVVVKPKKLRPGVKSGVQIKAV